MKQTKAYGASTLQGNWPALEDGFFLDPLSEVFMVCDGIGGKGSGDVSCRDRLREARAFLQELSGDKHDVLEEQRALLSFLNKKQLDWNKSQPPVKQAACSFTVGRVVGGSLLTVSNCGANAVLLYRGGRLLSLLSPQADLRPYSGTPLYPISALGLNPEPRIESRVITLLPLDVVLFTSSGLEWDSADFAEKLGGALATRETGATLGPLAEQLTAGYGGVPGQEFNRTLLLFETPAFPGI